MVSLQNKVKFGSSLTEGYLSGSTSLLSLAFSLNVLFFGMDYNYKQKGMQEDFRDFLMVSDRSNQKSINFYSL